MSGDKSTRAVLTMQLDEPQTAADVRKWIDLAQRLGVPDTAPVAVVAFPPSINVRAFLDRLDSSW